MVIVFAVVVSLDDMIAPLFKPMEINAFDLLTTIVNGVAP